MSVRHETKSTSRAPWLDVAALALLWIAVALGQLWVFGILFIVWALYDIAGRRTRFITLIPQDRHPMAFWLVALSWLAFGVLAFWA